MRTRRWLVTVALAWLSGGCATIRQSLRPPSVRAVAAPPSLQVPYIAQSVLLCGGAAIAMLERWWGRRGVYADDFAALVRPAEGGIRTDDLTHALQSRGWTTRSAGNTAVRLQQSIDDSVPVIALIRVAPDRYHYVVVIGWRNGSVIYHDPAVAPSVRVDSATFLRRWTGANRWALVVRPGSPRPGSVSATESPAAAAVIDSLPCRPWLDLAADAAVANDLETADRYLATAHTRCPDARIVQRELAGVRFRQGRHADAVRLADDYTRHVPNDTLGLRLLASSRYLGGDPAGALRAWNVIGTPAIDLLRIDGIARTRFSVPATAMAIGERRLLTPPRLALARRRLADIPSFSRTRVEYAAVAGGAVEVRASVVEPPMIAPLPQLAATGAIDAIFRRDASVSLATPLGLGEQWTLQWRWQPADPRVAVRLVIPARIGVPAIVRFERSWETYDFSASLPTERREQSSVSLRAWAQHWLEGLAGARLERWSGLGNFAAVSAGVGLHDTPDRVALLTEGEHAIPLNGGRAYDRLRAHAAWTPPADRWRNSWSVRAGMEWSSATTPVALQPLAGGDLAREIPLRAHPFLLGRTLPAARIARMITHGGIAADRAITTRGPLALGAGIFLDAAHLRSPADASVPGPRLYLDAGAGLRIGLAGTQWAALRLDVARGLAADRRWGLIAGLAPAWPVRLGRAR